MRTALLRRLFPVALGLVTGIDAATPEACREYHCACQAQPPPTSFEECDVWLNWGDFQYVNMCFNKYTAYTLEEVCGAPAGTAYNVRRGTCAGAPSDCETCRVAGSGNTNPNYLADDITWPNGWITGYNGNVEFASDYMGLPLPECREIAMNGGMNGALSPTGPCWPDRTLCLDFPDFSIEDPNDFLGDRSMSGQGLFPEPGLYIFHRIGGAMSDFCMSCDSWLFNEGDACPGASYRRRLEESSPAAAQHNESWRQLIELDYQACGPSALLLLSPRRDGEMSLEELHKIHAAQSAALGASYKELLYDRALHSGSLPANADPVTARVIKELLAACDAIQDCTPADIRAIASMLCQDMTTRASEKLAVDGWSNEVDFVAFADQIRVVSPRLPASLVKKRMDEASKEILMSRGASPDKAGAMVVVEKEPTVPTGRLRDAARSLRWGGRRRLNISPYYPLGVDCSNPPAGCGAGTCGSSASINGDPQVTGADGDRFAVRGSHLGIYNLLSTPDLSMNAQFENTIFPATVSKKMVNGSFVRSAFWVLQTPSGPMHISFDARQLSHVKVDGRTDLVCDGNQPFSRNGITMSFRKAKLRLETPKWLVTAVSTRALPHRHRTRMNIRVEPRYSVCDDPVAPHGLLGQTFDCDGLALDGQQDDYVVDGQLPWKKGRRLDKEKINVDVASTKAQGEGGIEGTVGDYQVEHPFATSFAFTRFNTSEPAPRRKAHALSGRKERRRLDHSSTCSCPGRIGLLASPWG